MENILLKIFFEAFPFFRLFARNHRDRIIRALRRAIAAADTGVEIYINLAVRKTRNRAGRATRQAFRVLAMQTDRRHQNALCLSGFRFDGTFDMDTAPDEPRKPVNFMTRQRTIAAPDTFRHIHHEQIHAVHHARFDLFSGGVQNPRVNRRRRF